MLRNPDNARLEINCSLSFLFSRKKQLEVAFSRMFNPDHTENA
jgi:hypothetical protein